MCFTEDARITFLFILGICYFDVHLIILLKEFGCVYQCVSLLLGGIYVGDKKTAIVHRLKQMDYYFSLLMYLCYNCSRLIQSLFSIGKRFVTIFK